MKVNKPTKGQDNKELTERNPEGATLPSVAKKKGVGKLPVSNIKRQYDLPTTDKGDFDIEQAIKKHLRDKKPYNVSIYCKGICHDYGSPGGYGSIIRFNDKTEEISGGSSSTSPNRMEMNAAIAALESLGAVHWPCRVTIFTKSFYLTHGLTEKEELERYQFGCEDLWKRLSELEKRYDIGWVEIVGHSDLPENDRCEFLAKSVIKSYRVKN